MDKKNSQLILVANPGSASRKYSLYEGLILRGHLHFEFENSKVICTFSRGSLKKKVKLGVNEISLVTKQLVGILYRIKILDPSEDLAAIGIRIVAPGKFFTGDHLVTTPFMQEIYKASSSAPLHIAASINEIQNLIKAFPGTDVIAISDSAFHQGRPPETSLYAIDPKLADEHDIKRWGYHGISLASVTDQLRRDKRYSKLSRLVVAHLGSGCSITAIKDWKSYDTSMGYSPLEGSMSSTRSGSIDVSAALHIKKVLRLNDEGLEDYLNKNAGLLAVSQISDDIRVLQKTDKKAAKLALSMFVHSIVCEIGRMITELGGIDALVFSGTVGERSFFIRNEIIKQLTLFGFKLSSQKNLALTAPQKIEKISRTNKPQIIVVPTDENLEITRRVLQFIA